MTRERPWVVVNPSEFIDERKRFTRSGLIVVQRVRSYRARVGRALRAGGDEFDRCDHAHARPGSARKCAEVLARRKNRAER